MHESSLGKQIVDISLAAAEEAKGSRIRGVRGWVAETETLSGQAIELHFRAHARGTKAEGARLELELRHVSARCRTCATTYLPEHHLLLCPSCGSTDGEELGERGLKIEAIDLDDDG